MFFPIRVLCAEPVKAGGEWATELKSKLVFGYDGMSGVLSRDTFFFGFLFIL